MRALLFVAVVACAAALAQPPPDPAMDVEASLSPPAVERGGIATLAFSLTNRMAVARTATVRVSLPPGVSLASSSPPPQGGGPPHEWTRELGPGRAESWSLSLEAGASGAFALSLSATFPAGGEGSPRVTLERELSLVVADQLPRPPRVEVSGSLAEAPGRGARLRAAASNEDPSRPVEVEVRCALPDGLEPAGGGPDREIRLTLPLEADGSAEREAEAVAAGPGSWRVPCAASYRLRVGGPWAPLEARLEAQLGAAGPTPPPGMDPRAAGLVDEAEGLRARTEDARSKGELAEEEARGMLAAVEEGRSLAVGGEAERAALRLAAVNATLEGLDRERSSWTVHVALWATAAALAVVGVAAIAGARRAHMARRTCPYCGMAFEGAAGCPYCSDGYSRTEERKVI